MFVILAFITTWVIDSLYTFAWAELGNFNYFVSNIGKVINSEMRLQTFSKSKMYKSIYVHCI